MLQNIKYIADLAALGSVEFQQDAVQTLEANEHVEAVEVDGEVKTQKKD